MIVPCQRCGKKLKITPELFGKRVKCPACTTIFQIPETSEEVSRLSSPGLPEEKTEEKSAEKEKSKGSTTLATQLSGMEISDADFENKYEIIDEIARGGMGIVYKARQKSLNRLVAIKVMLSGENASDMDVKRFLREADACAKLKHPNIVDILDIGKYGNNFYFAMEYIDGETFDNYVKRMDVELEDKLNTFIQVVQALEYAHERHIIHRDLKPVNIMMTEAGVPKIMDFGLAKKLKEAEGEDALSLKTATGAVIGTPHYMSPEQANGDTELIDHHTDIFALGIIMYEMVTGVRPFRGNNIHEILFSIFNVEPERPVHLIKNLDWELEAIILKAMEKDIPRRYQTAKEMRSDIQRFLNGKTIRAKKISKLYLLRKRIRKNKIQFALGTLLVLVLVGTGSYFTWDFYRTKKAREIEIGKYEKWAETGIAEAEKLLIESGDKREYPELSTKLENVKADITNLVKLDEDNITAKEITIKIDTINKTIEDKIKTASALEKCRKGDTLLKSAEKDLSTDDKVKRLDGMKKILDALQAYNEAFLIKPNLKKAQDGRFASTMRLGKAARADKGYNLAILMYHQAKAIMPGNKEVAKLYKETEEEASNLKFYQQQVARGKQFLTERKWEEAQSCFRLAQEKITDNPEIPGLIQQAEFGKKYDNARETAAAGRFIESLGLFKALRKEAPEDWRNDIEREISDITKTGTNTYLNQAKNFFKTGNYKEAENMLKNVAALTPGNNEAKSMLNTIREITQTPENLIYIKEGEFRKGSAEADANNPLKRITVGSFYIGKYEVTNSEYYAFVNDRGYREKEYWDTEGWKHIDEYMCGDGRIRGPLTWVEGKPPVGSEDFPVNGVSVYEAKAFARWKSKKTGRSYRLCTEWEWEKAASWDSTAKKKRIYPWGDSWSSGTGNFGSDAVKAGAFTKDRSPYGCFDMGGNVSEWTRFEERNRGILRGGTFGQPESLAKTYARTASRNIPQNGHIRSRFIGFRLACSVKK